MATIYSNYPQHQHISRKHRRNQIIGIICNPSCKFQFRVLLAEPSQLGPLRLGQRSVRGRFPLGLNLSLTHFRIEVSQMSSFFGDFTDCMAAVEDQRDRVPLVLIGEASSWSNPSVSLLCLRAAATSSGVHRSGNGPGKPQPRTKNLAGRCTFAAADCRRERRFPTVANTR